MRKNLTILLAVILMMVTGATLSYAAFPVSQGNDNATATASQQSASDESQSNAAFQNEKVMKVTKPMPGYGSKSQVVALVLVLLVGSLGIHRFYLGYTWQGIVQLLTLGGCGIWAFIDLIRILTGSLQPKNGSYGKTL